MSYEFKIFDPPPADLQPYLYRSFSITGTIPVSTFQVLPAGMVVAIFVRGQGEPGRAGFASPPQEIPLYTRGWVHGVYTTPAYHIGGNANSYGLRFEPIGLHALFGTDMRDLTDKFVAPSAVFPNHVLSAIENLQNVSNTQAGQNEIYQILLQCLSKPLDPWLLDFYRLIKSTRGSLSLAQAYEKTGLSPKYVNERFKRAVGVAPKILSRILRLDALLEELDPDRDVNWAELAHRFGFYDQPHFNREFKKFSGLPPSKYLHLRRNGPMPMPKGDHHSVIAER
jgi:AraC-like DNA-binding protein